MKKSYKCKIEATRYNAELENEEEFIEDPDSEYEKSEDLSIELKEHY